MLEKERYIDLHKQLHKSSLHFTGKSLQHWIAEINELMPPIPEATTVPRRIGSISGAPASAQASRAAMIAHCSDGSMRRTSTGFKISAGLSRISAAICAGCSGSQSAPRRTPPGVPAIRWPLFEAAPSACLRPSANPGCWDRALSGRWPPQAPSE